MKKLAIAAVFLLAATPGFAAAKPAGTTLVNKSGIDIDHLYVAPHGGTEWSADLMAGAPHAALDKGKSFALAGLKPGTYDLKVEDEDDGMSCVIANVVVKGKAVTLTKKEGKSCK